MTEFNRTCKRCGCKVKKIREVLDSWRDETVNKIFTDVRYTYVDALGTHSDRCRSDKESNMLLEWEEREV